MDTWTLTYLDIDVANQTMHVQFTDHKGKHHEHNKVPFTSYVVRRVITTVFGKYIYTGVRQRDIVDDCIDGSLPMPLTDGLFD